MRHEDPVEQFVRTGKQARERVLQRLGIDTEAGKPVQLFRQVVAANAPEVAGPRHAV
jgi:hypothetical protein